MTAPIVTFVIPCHAGDAHLTVRLLAQLHVYHPRAPCVVQCDGPTPPYWLEQMGLSALVLSGVQLKPTPGSAWLERLLTVALEHTSTEVIIKLDPDVFLRRPIRDYPKSPLFGRVVGPHEVLGCARGMRRELLAAILESGMLREDWTKHTYTRRDYQGGESVLSCEDYILRDVHKRLGVVAQPWDELDVRHRPAMTLEQVKRSEGALCHPVL